MMMMSPSNKLLVIIMFVIFMGSFGIGVTSGYRYRETQIKPCPLPTPTISVANLGAAADLPNFLLIRGERWAVIETTFIGNQVGKTDCDHRAIYYQDLHNTAANRENLWHEITHAANCKFEEDALANWKPYTIGSPTHDTVYKMGSFLADFGLANPDFMRWASNE